MIRSEVKQSEGRLLNRRQRHTGLEHGTARVFDARLP